jgi:succinate dehydrogenase/fumarate reductase flavoprotein subunit
MCHEDWTLWPDLSMTSARSQDGVVVIGAGMGGLSAAIYRAARGVPVTLV